MHRITPTLTATALAVALTACAVGAFGVPAATAAPLAAPTGRHVELSPETLSEAHSFFTEFGVAQAVEDRLIAAYEAGETWQSTESSSQPTDTRVVSEAGSQLTVNTYADGSINVLRQETVTATPSAISGCGRSGYSYTNCTIDFWYGIVSMSFRADYNLTPGNNRITSQWGASWSIGGACGTSQNYFGRPNSRTARLEVQAQMCGVPYSTTFFLELSVSGNASHFTFG